MENKIFISEMEYFIPNSLLPYKDKIIRKSNDFNKNVFIMIKYREANLLLRNHIKDVLKKIGFNAVYANDTQWKITDDVYNPLAVLCCCKYGIAIFDSPEEAQSYNPNVAYELGIMHFQIKECLILMNKNILDPKPFDLLAKIYKSYTDSLEIEGLIKTWVEEIKAQDLNVSNDIDIHSSAIGSPAKIVAISVVKKKNKILITERARPEKEFKYGFPAGRLERVKANDDEYVKNRLRDECFNETNIYIEPKTKLGERIHPVTHARLIYWACDYISGKKINKDKHELKSVEWMTYEEVCEFFENDIYEEVRNYLKHS